MTNSQIKSKKNQISSDCDKKEKSLESKKVRCYVALGSNMGNSEVYLRQAIIDLESHPKIENIVVSNYYKSKPHGPQDQPDYLNAAVEFETELSAIDLLNTLQKIETENDRVREGVIRWGARTLDLDVLFYGKEIIETKRLTVPHPRICERAFVLYPMRDLLETRGAMESLKTLNNHSILECIERLSETEQQNIKAVELKNE